jgi:hypothetical protein
VSHLYVSTACHHDRHELCRLVCKYCGAPCVCDHHFIEGVTVTEPVDNPATPDVDNDGETYVVAEAVEVADAGDETPPPPPAEGGNDDADDDLSDVPEGDDDDEDLDDEDGTEDSDPAT